MQCIRLRPLIRDPRNLIGLIPAKGTRVITQRHFTPLDLVKNSAQAFLLLLRTPDKQLSFDKPATH